jgi:ANTAR domain
MADHERAWADDRQRFIAESDAAPVRDPRSRPGPLDQQFARLTASLLNAATVVEVLDQVVLAAKQLLPAVDIASITVRRDRVLHTPAETDRLAITLDELQYRFNEGPCFDASRPDGPAMVACSDLGEDTMWPTWAPVVRSLGVSAVHSTAMIASTRDMSFRGALNLYSHAPRGLADVDLTQALLLATHGALALAHTDAVARGELEATQLRRAIDSRDVIGQAKGIIMARRSVPADQAFDLLRRASQDLNVKLAELAETLATRHTELDLP